MQVKQTEILSPDQKEKVMHLWNGEYPVKLGITEEGFENYLQRLNSPKHFLLQDDEQELAGWAFTFERDGERWFSIIVDRRFQRMGMGKQLLEVLKAKESCLNGWVIDHEVEIRKDGKKYISPLPFYLKNGFQVSPETRYESPELSAVKISWRKPKLVSDRFDID